MPSPSWTCAAVTPETPLAATAGQPAMAPAGFGTFGVAVDAASPGVYAVNDEDASVSLVRGRRCRACHTSGCLRPPMSLPADDYPTGAVALAPSVRTAYVTSSAKGTVSLVSMRP